MTYFPEKDEDFSILSVLICMPPGYPTKNTAKPRKTARRQVLVAAVGCFLWGPASAQATNEVSQAWFADPPFRFRPAATTIVGPVPPAEIPAQLKPILVDRGFGGVLLMPKENRPRIDPLTTRDPTIRRVVLAARSILAKSGPQEPLPDFGQRFTGPAPSYLSQEYFRRYRAALAFAKAHGRTAVLYDELGYPSGSAGGGRIEPKYYRKLLTKTEIAAATDETAYVSPGGVLAAAVAMNTRTRQRLDLTGRMRHGVLTWAAPGPHWKVMFFTIVTSTAMGGVQDYHAIVDYTDPQAVRRFIDVTYEAYARHLGAYFGNTITMTFFDDVGVYSAERTWGLGFAKRFAARYRRNPDVLYPALWEDIGPDTAAARVALFKTRAEMIADGFPALVSAWAARHGLKASGHTPGAYEIQPTDMNGDPFLFYRAQPVPMFDVIFTYGFGREGFKITTSAADAMDKPVVAAEQFTTCGTPQGYKRAMDSFVRGVNFLITCAASDVGTPSAFAKWAGRASMLLQGGRRVADIAVVYPIASLQAYYGFEAPDNTTGPVGQYAPPSADYLSVGDMLTGDLHRDFTFVHPDDLASSHLKVFPGKLILDNRTNRQAYSVVLIPGGEVLSAAALRKIKAFYDAGGKVIATTKLPARSAEFGRDGEVQELVGGIFGTADGAVRRNRHGGASVFVAKPTPAALREAFDALHVAPDVAFSGDPHPRSGGGELAYLHKVKAGKDIWLIANSSDDRIATTIGLRGDLKPQFWDAYSGRIDEAGHVTHGDGRTALPITVEPGHALFLVAAHPPPG